MAAPEFTARPNTSQPSAPSISGAYPRSFLMLGETGAGATGSGTWVKNGAAQSTVFLRQHESPFNAALGSAVVQIQGTNALDIAADETDTSAFKVLATLNAAGPSAEIGGPWRYLRAVVTTFDTNPVQVDLNVIEL